MSRILQDRLALSTGVTLAYAAKGDPKGLPLVLLHGITDSHRSFAPLMAELPDSIRAIALTARGHGDSDKPEGRYGLDLFAADVAAALDALQLPSAVILGHSMGSMVAQRFAIDHPGRVRGLALAGALSVLKGLEEVEAFYREAIAPLTDPVPRELAVEFQQSTLTHPVPPAFFEMVVGESLKVPARVWREAFKGLIEADLAAGLSTITAPTRLFWGDLDKYATRQAQDLLLASVRGSELVTFEGYDHALHWEDPARFAWELNAFLQTLAIPA
ncbi:alpha/beta fold hydrolase [Phenylobacterium terrae]|uniref:Alpha/beta fold hydrolase n=1 Tax=Phenylobacterium terrae TaxID=2665495 RepID=A0ABW4N2L9_9CAUL